jgi:hypothetical protein
LETSRKSRETIRRFPTTYNDPFLFVAGRFDEAIAPQGSAPFCRVSVTVDACCAGGPKSETMALTIRESGACRIKTFGKTRQVIGDLFVVCRMAGAIAAPMCADCVSCRFL